nr:M28 family peptidase [Gemmatimonadota bacterium]NIQ57166.1 M28 family peptidase [Gemmatimonadota bacterium]NIU77341.1 M28 family peptidase [Gammaproteobacteria bacterium]NIX46599.1 M28 family peptidase [Gemmatimonadota bacterium]NIY10923.1 M28 family peptidase [Gemmatimonadota bacterium]
MRHMRLMPAVLLLSAVGAACADDPVDPPDPDPAVPDVDSLLVGLAMDDAAARITATDIGAHVGALAHDSMKGRRTGRPEIEAAAAYIAGALADAGLEPAGREGYLDRWTFDAGPGADSLASRPPNVVALLPGSDPALAGTFVVVTAHFDHVGVGPPDETGDSIYNGADDNASGTAALLEVAEALASLPAPPRRSVLFLAVSG